MTISCQSHNETFTRSYVASFDFVHQAETIRILLFLRFKLSALKLAMLPKHLSYSNYYVCGDDASRQKQRKCPSHFPHPAYEACVLWTLAFWLVQFHAHVEPLESPFLCAFCRLHYASRHAASMDPGCAVASGTRSGRCYYG